MPKKATVVFTEAELRALLMICANSQDELKDIVGPHLASVTAGARAINKINTAWQRFKYGKQETTNALSDAREGQPLR